MRIASFKEFFRKKTVLERLAMRQVGPDSIGAVSGALFEAGFSPSAYRLAYDDLAQALPCDNAATLHFIAFCQTDMRPFPIDLRLQGLRRLFTLRAPALFKARAAVALLNVHCAPSSPLWSAAPETQGAFWAELMCILRLVGAPYLIVGDSHSNLYRRIVIDQQRLLIPVPILCSGCSALGLANPNSRSGAGARLTQLGCALAQSSAAASVPILFDFGQVDVEFVFNFDRVRRAQRQFLNEEFERFCKRSVEAYLDFVAANFRAESSSVISIFPPALSDASWREGYVNAHVVALESGQDLDAVVAGVRELEIPSLKARTHLHDDYNQLLRNAALHRGLGFLDAFRSFLQPDGSLDPRFIPSHRGSDHHLEEKPAAPVIDALIAKHLRRCLAAFPRRDVMR